MSFHAVLWNRPETGIQVDLFPLRATHLSRSRGSENGKLQGKAAKRLPLPQPDHEVRNASIGHRCEVAFLLRLAGAPLRDGPHGSLAFAIAGGVGPIEHRADTLAHSPGRLGLRKPDICKHVAYQRTGYLVDLQVADLREDVGLKRARPLLLVLLVTPGLAVRREHTCRRLPEGRDASRFATLEDGVEAHLDPGANLPGALARERE